MLKNEKSKESSFVDFWLVVGSVPMCWSVFGQTLTEPHSVNSSVTLALYCITE